MLADADGRSGATDQALRRFDADELTELLAQASLSVTSCRGVGLLDELTSRQGKVADDDLALALNRTPQFVEVAPYLHLLAQPTRHQC